MADPVWYALSIKQPWAALIVAGVKSVEVRTWGTSRRGPILIHAARIPDPRPEGWSYVSADLLPQTRQLGGIVGVGELSACIRYDNATDFQAATQQHRNAPEWFQPPALYGLEFQDVRALPFYPVTGKTFFFPVPTMPILAPENI
jgi:hypothetical protein